MTDWKLIRELMNSAINACEELENLEVKGEEQSATTPVNGQDISVWEFFQSSWIWPENNS